MKLLIKANDLYVEYHGKTILDIEAIEVYDYDRIGIVGSNGSGKSTLLKVLLNKLKPDEGRIDVYGTFQYISQLESGEDAGLLSQFDVLNKDIKTMSGGEITKMKISNAFSQYALGIVADEPTSFLDYEGVDLLLNQFKYYPGAVITVSHDRYFLDELVTQIWELDEGKLTIYEGNYSDYKTLKEAEEQRTIKEYEQYLSKKQELEKSIAIKRRQAERVMKKNKQNKRKNNTKDGGRLSMQKDVGTKEKKLFQQASSMKKELEQMEVKAYIAPKTRFKLNNKSVLELNNDYPISVRNLHKSYGDKLIFDDVSFDIPIGSKVAFVGANGAGKTSLFKMILHRDEGVHIASKVRIGYFKQDSFLIQEDVSVYEAMKENSNYTESDIRGMLASIGFFAQDVHKPLTVLSGGEIMKLRLAKLMSESYNVLILDEPTNFLDIDALEVIEQMMKDYEGTILFTTHDRHLLASVADVIYDIDNKKIVERF